MKTLLLTPVLWLGALYAGYVGNNGVAFALLLVWTIHQVWTLERRRMRG